MASLTVDLSGDRELIRKIESLGNQIKPIASRVLRTAAAPILSQAKANAPVRSGALRASLKVRKATSRQGRVRIIVSTSAGDFQGKQYYGAFVEYGHKVGSRKLGSARKDVAPVRYIGRAWDALSSQTEQAVKQGFKDEIEKAAKTV